MITVTPITDSLPCNITAIYGNTYTSVFSIKLTHSPETDSCMIRLAYEDVIDLAMFVYM